MVLTPCIPIVKEEIRAEVYLGTQLIARTPYVTNFNITESRSQQSATCNVTLELLAGTTFNSGQKLTIKAGLKGNLKTRFTGIIEKTSTHPAHAKPSYYSLTIECRGVLSELENKTFSRRLKSDGQGMYCLITAGPENRPDRGRTLDKIIKAGNHTVITSSPSLAKEGEHSPLIVSSTTAGGIAGGGTLEAMAGKLGGGSSNAAAAEGLGVHTHENMEQGGPAFAVYAAD